MNDKIKANKKELWEYLEKLCESPITFPSVERIVTCHKAYKILCEMAGGHAGHDVRERADTDTNYRLTEAIAKAWTSSMENADGTRGAHWTMEKTEEVRRQRGIAADPLEWWVAMNMIYSDYCVVADKLGTSTAEFYAGMARAFLDDKDAQPEKLGRYYEYIVKH